MTSRTWFRRIEVVILVGGDDRDGVGGDGDKKQDKPGKLLGQGWGGEGAPSPAIMILL